MEAVAEFAESSGTDGCVQLQIGVPAGSSSLQDRRHGRRSATSDRAATHAKRSPSMRRPPAMSPRSGRHDRPKSVVLRPTTSSSRSRPTALGFRQDPFSVSGSVPHRFCLLHGAWTSDAVDSSGAVDLGHDVLARCSTRSGAVDATNRYRSGQRSSAYAGGVRQASTAANWTARTQPISTFGVGATLPGAGTINGGTDTVVSAGWGVVGFALIGTTVSGPTTYFGAATTDYAATFTTSRDASIGRRYYPDACGDVHHQGARTVTAATSSGYTATFTTQGTAAHGSLARRPRPSLQPSRRSGRIPLRRVVSDSLTSTFTTQGITTRSAASTSALTATFTAQGTRTKFGATDTGLHEHAHHPGCALALRIRHPRPRRDLHDAGCYVTPRDDDRGLRGHLHHRRGLHRWLHRGVGRGQLGLHGNVHDAGCHLALRSSRRRAYCHPHDGRYTPEYRGEHQDFTGTFTTTGTHPSTGATIQALAATFTTVGTHPSAGASSEDFAATFTTQGTSSSAESGVVDAPFTATFTTVGTHPSAGAATQDFTSTFTTQGVRTVSGVVHSELQLDLHDGWDTSERRCSAQAYTATFTTVGTHPSAGAALPPSPPLSPRRASRRALRQARLPRVHRNLHHSGTLHCQWRECLHSRRHLHDGRSARHARRRGRPLHRHLHDRRHAPFGRRSCREHSRRRSPLRASVQGSSTARPRRRSRQRSPPGPQPLGVAALS